MLDAPREGDAGEGGAGGPAERAERRGEAVQGAEDAQARGAVGQQDGGAGEADDDGEGLDDQDGAQGRVPRRRVVDEHREGRHDVDEREGDDAHLEAVQHAEAGAQHREQEELDKPRDDAVAREDGADPGVRQSEAAGEVEGEGRVLGRALYGRVVEEHGQDLIVGDGMQS